MSSFERRGIPKNRHPRQVYYGAVGKTRRYFAFKPPIAVEADSAVFVYVDPGHATAKSLRAWAAAHHWHKIAPSRSRSMVTVLAGERSFVTRFGCASRGSRADPGV